MAVQDVYAALREIEFSNVMELGAVGEDGRLGGRLEREVEVYEEAIMRKRKGYREKVKARESGGGGGEGETEDRGEPSSKKARRTSEQEEAEEQRMLELQLQGAAELASPSPDQEANSMPTSNEPPEISVVLPNGHARGKDKATPAADDDDLVSEPRSDLDLSAGGEEDEEQEDEDEEDDDDEEETQQPDDENDADEIDDSRLTNGHGRGLLPNGEVELGSDEESD